MMLFIDIDRDKSTGWYGYDYIVNRKSPTSGKVIVEKTWVTAGNGKRWRNHRMWLKITGWRYRSTERYSIWKEKQVDFEFKWNDNMQENGNIMDFYVNGDTAPGGRFNFVYSE